jgi:hypothetical protein
MNRKNLVLLAVIGLIALIAVPSVFIYAQKPSSLQAASNVARMDSLNVAQAVSLLQSQSALEAIPVDDAESYEELPALSEQEINDLIDRAEKEGKEISTPRKCWWIALTTGYSWKIPGLPPSTEVAPTNKLIPMGMILAARPYLVTSDGLILYHINGFVIHDGEFHNVRGVAIKCKSFFAMKLDGSYDFRLFAVGRVYNNNGVYLRMRGWMNVQGSFFAFYQHGKAFRYCIPPPPRPTPTAETSLKNGI